MSTKLLPISINDETVYNISALITSVFVSFAIYLSSSEVPIIDSDKIISSPFVIGENMSLADMRALMTDMTIVVRRLDETIIRFLERNRDLHVDDLIHIYEDLGRLHYEASNIQVKLVSITRRMQHLIYLDQTNFSMHEYTIFRRQTGDFLETADRVKRILIRLQWVISSKYPSFIARV